MDNWRDTVISQYANSPILLEMIEKFNDAVDPSVDIDAFYTNVWNISTAVGYGLDIWGRIVNIPRQLTITSSLTYFGFEDGVNDYAPFGQEPFYAGSFPTQNYTLSDDAYRSLILVKAMTNIAATNIPTLNKIITALFSSRGRCYVSDLGNMQMSYHFEFMLEPFELAILTNSGALAHPTGVRISIVQVTPTVDTFGFLEAGTITSAPFNQGTFRSS
jgi:Protein of unknown function (DUF2612)